MAKRTLRRPKSYDPKRKFELILESLRGERSGTEIARAHEVHPVTFSNWKRQFLEHGAAIFGGNQETWCGGGIAALWRRSPPTSRNCPMPAGRAMPTSSSCSTWAVVGVGGWAVGASANHLLALAALDRLRAQLASWGVDLRDRIVHHDQDPAFTSTARLRRLLLGEHARVSFTEHGAGDNPAMESFWGRFKTENRTLIREAQTLSEITELIPERIDYYNRDRRHSSFRLFAVVELSFPGPFL